MDEITYHFFLSQDFAVEYVEDPADGEPLNGEFLCSVVLDEQDAISLFGMLTQAVESTLQLLTKQANQLTIKRGMN